MVDATTLDGRKVSFAPGEVARVERHPRKDITHVHLRDGTHYQCQGDPLAKAEPVKAEPVKAEPVKAEPVKAEPTSKR